MSTVVITGGTGLIGTALTSAFLGKSYEVIILTRKLPNGKPRTINPIPPGHSAGDKLSYALWDIQNGTIDTEAIRKADYIIHLAGASVGEKRWTEERKHEIAESRINSSALLVKALSENENHVKAVISASGAGWYGEDPSIPNPVPFKEGHPPAEDFLGQTCKEWEEAIEPVSLLGKRLVKLRTGIVLSREGGALAEFKKLLR